MGHARTPKKGFVWTISGKATRRCPWVRMLLVPSGIGKNTAHNYRGTNGIKVLGGRNFDVWITLSGYYQTAVSRQCGLHSPN